MTINWTNYPFEALSNTLLYQIVKLRQEVFVVEQCCPYLDCDGLDPIAYHLCGVDSSGKLIGYARIFPVGVLPRQSATVIGRVVVTPEARGRGLGYDILQNAEYHHPSREYYLGAQAHLEDFYNKAGYQTVGNRYDEDGIPHLPMKKTT